MLFVSSHVFCAVLVWLLEATGAAAVAAAAVAAAVGAAAVGAAAAAEGAAGALLAPLLLLLLASAILLYICNSTKHGTQHEGTFLMNNTITTYIYGTFKSH